jgi:hypothetical protein
MSCTCGFRNQDLGVAFSPISTWQRMASLALSIGIIS